MADLPSPARASTNVLAVVSFACLALQALWVAACYLFAARPGPDQATAEDVVKGWIAVLAAMFGVSSVSACCRRLALLSGSPRLGWGVLALVFNAVAFLGTAVPLLLLILTPKASKLHSHSMVQAVAYFNHQFGHRRLM